MKLVFTHSALTDFNYWKRNDAARAKKIKRLLQNIMETPFSGIGKPEALKHSLSGHWSRRVDPQHRIIYAVDDDTVTVISCCYHYEK